MDASLRRTPVQARSRERIESLLRAATELIAERGSDALSMSDVAERADVSIGSLYQYFPGKSALVRALATRYNDVGRSCISEALALAHDDEQLFRVFGDLWDAYYAMFRKNPVMAEIWAAIAADKGLRTFEREESRVNASLLAGAITRVSNNVQRSKALASSLLIMQLGESTMRLASALPTNEAKRAVEAFKRMAIAELRYVMQTPF